MTKTTFIRELKWALKFKLPKNETKDIISDYEEYFQVGISEGKTEDELCKAFGNPKTISKELSLSATTTRATEVLDVIKENLPYLLLIFSAFTLFYKFYSGQNSQLFTNLYILILPIIMIYCVYQRCENAPLKKPILLVSMLACQAVLLGIIAIINFNIPISEYDFTLIDPKTVTTVKILSFLLLMLALITWLYILTLSKKHGENIFPLHFLQAGIFAAGICLYYYIDGERMSSFMLGNTISMLYPSVFGIAFTLFAYVTFKGNAFKRLPNVKRVVAYLLVGTSMLLVTSSPNPTDLTYNQYLYCSLGFALIFPIILIYLMRTESIDTSKITKKSITINIALIALQLLFFSIASVLMLSVFDIDKLAVFFPAHYIGPLYEGIFVLNAIFTTAVWLYEMNNSSKLKRCLWSLFFLNSGILLSLSSFVEILHSLDDPNAIMPHIEQAHYPLLIGVIIAIIFIIPYAIDFLHTAKFKKQQMED